MAIRATTTGGFIRTDSETAHFHRLFHEHEKSNERILPVNEVTVQYKCSAKRYKSEGLNTLDYKILSEENLHLIRNITVDLRFTTQHTIDPKCPYNYVFEELGKRFVEKVLSDQNEESKSDWLKNYSIAKSPALSKPKIVNTIYRGKPIVLKIG